MSVSVIIPTHNRPKLLVEAVASALKACPQDGEVVVVDDRSKVPATEVLSSIADPRLRVIGTREPPGISGTRNAGIRAASCDIVAFLDDDDLMETNHLNRVATIARDHPEAHWGFSNARRHDLSLDRKAAEALALSEGFVPQAKTPRYAMANAPRGFWARKNTLIAVGLFDIGWTVDEDTDLSLRLLQAGHAPWFSPAPGVLMRVNRPSDTDFAQTTSQIDHGRGVGAYRQTYERHRTQYPPLSSGRFFLASRYLRRAAKAGLAGPAARFVIRNEPMAPVYLAYLGLKVLRHRKTSGLAKE